MENEYTPLSFDIYRFLLYEKKVSFECRTMVKQLKKLNNILETRQHIHEALYKFEDKDHWIRPRREEEKKPGF